jgi:glycosyltransferase involved in cell wall biosynthesis
MRILFLTDNFPPEVNAPASRTFEHCREWVRAGHEVTVVTGAPNFPKGKVFDGYRNRLCATETVEGITVVRVWTYISANQRTLRRTLDYASYMLSATLASTFLKRPDIVVATSPQIFTACAGWMVARLRSKPFVFELRDLWPESIRAVGAIKNGGILRWLERMEMFLYRRAAGVVCVTNAFRDNLIGRGIEPAKISVVTNGADLSLFSPRPRDAALAEELGLTDAFVAGYVGTHGMAHALDTLLDAAARLKTMPGGERVRILLLGDGSAKARLKAKAKTMGLDNVIFIDTVSKDQVARYWSLLDVSIIHLKKTELFTTVIPSKLFEAMAMGIPVLHGLEGESAAIVESERAGLVFPPENDAVLADHLVKLALDPALRRKLAVRGRRAAAHYDRKVLAARMLALLEQIGGCTPPAPVAQATQVKVEAA